MRSRNWQMLNLTSRTATVCNGVGNWSNANTSSNCYNVRRQRYGGHGPTQPQLSCRPIWWCRLAMLLLIFCALAAAASGSANTRCDEEQFQCRDGSCILQAKMCDGRNDCTDATDELDCDYKLCREPHWFPCAQPHGACLAAELKCNGIDNCPGGEDELNCPVSARFASYRRLPARNCSLSQYMCQRDRSCIPIEFQCDGKPDCADSSDELAGCSTQSAASCSGHLCPNGRCLQRKQWLCDGVDDCGDGSDEHGCVDLCKPQLGKFMCRNKEQCLQLAQVCDGHSDCMDGSDESETCNIKPDCSSKTCPPAATCHMMPVDGAQCHCPAGFRLAKFGNKCVDIDECQEREPELCSQSCENTSGGYRCLCDPGYELARDNRTCRATISNASEHPLLLYTTQMNVMGMQLGSGQQHWSRHHVYQVAGNLSKVIGVAYDGSHVYWTNIQNEAESIVKAKSDGSHSEILLTSGLDAPEDLAVDWLTQNIYFSDNEMRHIAVCSHDAHNCVVLVTEDVHQPRGLALWPQRGQMFWTDWGVKPMIVRASMNGERSTPIVSDNIHWPNGIVVDMHQQRIYWVDAKLGSIQTVRPDGSGRRTVLDGILKHPYGLAVYEDQLYWSDWVTKSIHACHKYSGKQHRVLAKDSTIYAVHIYHPAKQPQTPNACASARCSHLCLLAEPEAGGHSCACPDGMKLAPDHQRCIQMVKRQRLFVGVGQYLLEIEHTAFGRHVVSASHALDCVISEMVYNSVNGSLIIADNERHIIVEYQPEQGRAQGQGHGQPLRTLIRSNLGNVSALAFDHISQNLYWADAERRVLELYSFPTRHRALIRFFAGQESPIGLSVMPADGYLFVALKARRQSYIDRLPLSGRGTPTHVFEDELGDDDIKMATDYEQHTLYWSDSDMGMIKYTDYRQTQALMFRNKLRRPYSLALVHQDLFWSELGSASIYWAHKSNMGPRKRIDVVPTRGDGDGDMHGQYPMSMGGAPWRLSLAASVSIGEEQQLHQQQHPCRQQNGGCSHICVGVGRLAATCLCPVGFVYRDASNRTCLEALDCEFRCHSSGECLTLAHRCNGRQDCVDRSDEEDCDVGHKPKPKVMCTNRQFACHNAEDCVEKNKRCDGHKDCPDNSDELHCSQFDKTKSCHAHQLACDNGKCVDQSLMCDGKNDCGDNTDENPSKCDSPASCDLGMFQCSSGACIAGSWECDGRIDCSDASDEHDKCGQRQCPADMHRCMLGQCLDRRLVCDGHNDCGDMTDELNCGIHDSPSKANICGTLYQCASNLKLCLDPAVRCNGTAECPRGEDEADCGDMCSINEFQCRSEKQCIRKEFRCDRAKDCSDGSDEENCDKIQNQTLSQPWTAASRACRPHLFDCHDGECVDMSRVCNSFPDCENGNDEGPLCATACKASSVAGGRPVCQHKCRATPTGAVCSCFDGYRLDTDQRSCVDVNECLEGNQPCAQICENTNGGYQCQCHADFMLHQDRVSCKSLQAGATLLFSSYNEVRNLSEQPMMLQVAWSANDSRIDGFDVDMERQLGYFSSEEQGIVYQVDMRRGSVTRALAVPSPTKLAVDWATGNVYVLAGGSASQEIYACSFTARMCGRILQVKTHMHLRHLAIDGYHGRLFYIAMRLEGFGHASAELHVARLDGSHKELMLHKKDSYMTALALDPHQQQLYYLDMHSRTLERISYRSRSGSGPHRRPEVMVQKSPALKQPSGLSIYENHAYIVNLGSKEAVRCRLYGERLCKSINLNVNNAQDIVVAGRSRQPMPATNPCQHSHCHGMCILADYGYECMCGSQLVAEGEQCPHGSSSELEVGASRQDRPQSSGSSIQRWLMALLVLVVGSLAVGLGYMYFRWRQRGHTGLNINLHFQNPLSTIGSKAFIDHERYEASVGINGNGMDGMVSSHSSSETGTTSASSSFSAQQFGMPNVLQRMLRPKQTSSSQMATEMLLENSRASELYTLDNGRKAARGGGSRVQDILVADTDDDAATGGSFGGDYAGDDANARLVP